MGQIATLQDIVYQNKLAHKFNVTDVQMEFLLIHGELAEAFDAWYKKNGKVGEELADVMIYLLGLAKILGVDLETEVEKKVKKNATRKYVKKNGAFVKEESNE